MPVKRSYLLFAFVLVILALGYTQSQEATTQQRTATTTNQETQQNPKVQQAPRTQPSKIPQPDKSQNLKYFIFREDCFDKFIQGNLDVDCIKFTISKGLSYGIIGGSLLYKAPQIIKILKSGSVEGLSLSSFYFQFVMVLITIGYNLHINAPVTTYAENLSIFVQNVILIILHWTFNPKTSRGCIIASTATFAALGYILIGGILPDFVYDGVGVINIILFVLAVAPQIRMNYENKSTGQLALITVLLSWGGNLARVFTTTQEVQDPLLLAFFLIGVVLNGTVLLQFFLYGGAKASGAKTTPTSKKSQ